MNGVIDLCDDDSADEFVKPAKSPKSVKTAKSPKSAKTSIQVKSSEVERKSDGSLRLKKTSTESPAVKKNIDSDKTLTSKSSVAERTSDSSKTRTYVSSKSPARRTIDLDTPPTSKQSVVEKKSDSTKKTRSSMSSKSPAVKRKIDVDTTPTSKSSAVEKKSDSAKTRSSMSSKSPAAKRKIDVDMTPTSKSSEVERKSDRAKKKNDGSNKKSINLIEKCWSCGIVLQNKEKDKEKEENNKKKGKKHFLYDIHSHPLLGISVCAACASRAYAIEEEAKELEREMHLINKVDPDAHEHEEMDVCSWCCSGLEDRSPPNDANKCFMTPDKNPDKDDTDDASTLFLCDECPRAFCRRCVCVSHGGGRLALSTVLKLEKGADKDTWQCPHCQPPHGLQRLQQAFNDHIGETSSIETHDAPTPESLVEELNELEDAIEEALIKLEPASLRRMKRKFEAELGRKNRSEVQQALEDMKRQWEDHHTRLVEAQPFLQDALQASGISLNAFYKVRDDERKKRKRRKKTHFYNARDKSSDEYDDSSDDEFEYDEDAEEEARRKAEKEMDRRDFLNGASGYQNPNPELYYYDLEDLPPDVLDIEDINTLEGSLSQITESINAPENSTRAEWRSHQPFPEDDTLRRKIFEKALTNDDLALKTIHKLTSKNFKKATESDDVHREQREKGLSVRMGPSNTRYNMTELRMVKTNEKRRAQSRKLNKKLRRISTDVVTPCPPLKTSLDSNRKRRISLAQDTKSNISAEDTQANKKIHVVDVDNDAPEPPPETPNYGFAKSDFILNRSEMESSKSAAVPIVKRLAESLKPHQKEGVQFLWDNVCQSISAIHQNPPRRFRREAQQDCNTVVPDSEKEVYGCILAHHMGLGKSLQVIALLHVLMTHSSLETNAKDSAAAPQSSDASSIDKCMSRYFFRVVVCAPVSTLPHWENEFEDWIGGEFRHRGVPSIHVHNLNSAVHKPSLIKKWYYHGGVLLCGADSYRNTCKMMQKKVTEDQGDGINNGYINKESYDTKVYEALREPDVLVLDEAHVVLKSGKSDTWKLFNSLPVTRRIALTGTPLQNNLKEYYQMVNWVKPGLLGPLHRFETSFEAPIMGGMASDSSSQAIQNQKNASTMLHQILSPYVHRRDDSALSCCLPPLQQVVLYVRQSKMQTKLYRAYKKYGDSNRLLETYSKLRPVFNHPGCLLLGKDLSPILNSNGVGNTNPIVPSNTVANAFLNEPGLFHQTPALIYQTSSESDNARNPVNANCSANVTNQLYPSIIPNGVINLTNENPDNGPRLDRWAQRVYDKDQDFGRWSYGGKIILLLNILAHSDLIGDKVVVFSQSLSTLDFIESCLNSRKWEEKVPSLPRAGKKSWGPWKKDSEYLRIDGKIKGSMRGELVKSFNDTFDDEKIKKSKVILISVLAGGLGINLNSANRVVLFDSHWNPSIDKQAFSRCYRYGQEKSVFVYRLLAEGTMEEKIYSRQVNKTGLAARVIDLKCPERHFTANELDDLLALDTWVQCDSCEKWRMLPPEADAENLPDKWYCHMNVLDPERAVCRAPEKNQKFYSDFFSKRMLPNNTESPSTVDVGSKNNPQEALGVDDDLVKKDTVLNALLERVENAKAINTVNPHKSSDHKKLKFRSWISRYHFHDSLLECEQAPSTDRVTNMTSEKLY